jgi:hypothetical protein
VVTADLLQARLGRGEVGAHLDSLCGVTDGDCLHGVDGDGGFLVGRLRVLRRGPVRRLMGGGCGKRFGRLLILQGRDMTLAAIVLHIPGLRPPALHGD